MTTPQRPHVSKAIQHLRGSVTLVGCALATCLALQVLLWCFVHFTEIHVKQLEPADEPAPVVVVQPQVQSLTGVKAADPAPVPEAAPREGVAEVEPADPNLVESAPGVALRRFADLVQVVGVISAITLLLLMLQGTVVAGGGGVPGVEMAVSATTWAIILVLLCVPLGRLVEAMPYEGAFIGYEALRAETDLYRSGHSDAPGAIALYATRTLLPLLLMGGVIACVFRFRIGVERGIIVTSMSELEERMEREIRARRGLGSLSTPRAMGALNQALGDVGAEPEPAPPPPPARKQRSMSEGRPILTDDGDYSRPI